MVVYDSILLICSPLTLQRFSAHLYSSICECICLVYLDLTVILVYHYLVRFRVRGFQKFILMHHHSLFNSE